MNRLHRALAAAAPPILFFALVVGLWEVLVAALEIPPFLLPGPSRVARAVWAHLPALGHATRLTAGAALGGFTLSFAAGFCIAVVFSQSRLVERSLYPYAIFLQTVPIVAVAPLIVLWIGHGLWGVIAVSFIISLFPIIANTTAGLSSVDADLLDLFALNSATRWQVLAKLRIPHAVPHMLTGARVSCGLSVIGAIVGEFFAGYGTQDFGLGYLIILNNAQTKTDYLFASVLFCTALGLAFFAVVNEASRRLLRRWSPASDH